MPSQDVSLASETVAVTIAAAAVESPRRVQPNPRIDVALQTPRRGTRQRCAGSAQSHGYGPLEVEGESDAIRTPVLKGTPCAICLSPMVRSSQDVYMVQLCKHYFHRRCLTENRRAGNTGCPYCRGALEQGLTPVASAEEKEQRLAASRQQEQRNAIRNAAGRARMALARSLRQGQEVTARQSMLAPTASEQDERGPETASVA